MKRSNNAAVRAAVAAQAKALAATLPRRQKILETRLAQNKTLLKQDIERWSAALSKLPENAPIRVHVGQFGVFWEAAHDCLLKQYSQAVDVPGEDRILFEMQIIGTLTAQWSVLRAIASQRLLSYLHAKELELLDDAAKASQPLPGYPYARELGRLDADMEQMYRRMCRALAEAGVGQAKEWPLPLLYLGRLAEIVLPDKQQAPAIISIPFGAADNIGDAQPIAHELGHLPGRRDTDLLKQMVEPARAALRAINPAHADILEELILPWFDEIVADLFGTALAGAPFVVSAVELMTAPEHLVNVTDREHPVALIRPYIHLQLLTYLKDEQAQKTVREQLAQYLENGEAPATAEACLDQLTAALLDRRLELSEKLAPLTLRAIKEATIAVVKGILHAQLKALGDKTLGDVLRRCADTSQTDGAEDKPAPPDWSTISEKECETFVLRRPGSTDQEWPGPTLRNLDDWLRWLQESLGTNKHP